MKFKKTIKYIILLYIILGLFLPIVPIYKKYEIRCITDPCGTDQRYLAFESITQVLHDLIQK